MQSKKSKILAIVKFYTAKCYLRIDEEENCPLLEGLTALDDFLLKIYKRLHTWLIMPLAKIFSPKKDLCFSVKIMTILDDHCEEKLLRTGYALPKG